MLLDSSYKILKKIFLDHMKSSSDMRVLDIGCGRMGNFCGIGPDCYYGADKNPRVIERLKHSGTGFFSVMDVKELKFESGYFDYVMGVSFLHHLSQDELPQAMSEVKRVLKKEGKAIFADGVYPQSKLNIAGWLIRFLDRGRHVRGRHSLRRLLSGYFHIDKEYYFVNKIFAYSLFVLTVK